MATVEQLEKENKELKSKVEKLEKENAMYKVHGGVGLYYELNRIVNDTVEYTRGLSIKTLLVGDGDSDGKSKGDKTFERTQALIKAAKEHIIDLAEIKDKLKLTGNKEKDTGIVPFIELVAEPRT